MGTERSPATEFVALQGHVGQEFGLSKPFTIDQFEENVFAALIGDYDPMHNDPSWQFDESLKQPIVLGFHALALSERYLRESGIPSAGSGLAVTTIGLGRVRFVAPLPVGQEARCSVRLDDAEIVGESANIRTTLTLARTDSQTPTMLAEHVGRVSTDGEQFSGGGAHHSALPPGPEIRSIPRGTPITDTGPYDNAFYEVVQKRAGQWLGSTPWTAVDSRSANTFRVLLDAYTAVANHPGKSPDGPTALTVHPLHLLALRSYFMPQVGLPVLTDANMAAFNYGLDGATWYDRVPVESRVRDHVQLQDVRQKSQGRWLVKTRHVVEAEGRSTAVLDATCLSLFAVLSSR